MTFEADLIILKIMAFLRFCNHRKKYTLMVLLVHSCVFNLNIARISCEDKSLYLKDHFGYKNETSMNTEKTNNYTDKYRLRDLMGLNTSFDGITREQINRYFEGLNHIRMKDLFGFLNQELFVTSTKNENNTENNTHDLKLSADRNHRVDYGSVNYNITDDATTAMAFAEGFATSNETGSRNSTYSKANDAVAISTNVSTTTTTTTTTIANAVTATGTNNYELPLSAGNEMGNEKVTCSISSDSQINKLDTNSEKEFDFEEEISNREISKNEDFAVDTSGRNDSGNPTLDSAGERNLTREASSDYGYGKPNEVNSSVAMSAERDSEATTSYIVNRKPTGSIPHSGRGRTAEGNLPNTALADNVNSAVESEDGSDANFRTTTKKQNYHEDELFESTDDPNSIHALNDPMKMVNSADSSESSLVKEASDRHDATQNEELPSEMQPSPAKSTNYTTEEPHNFTSTTTTVKTVESTEQKQDGDGSAEEPVQSATQNSKKDLNKRNVQVAETITLSLLNSSYCKEKKNNFRRISFLLKENIAKQLSIHLHDVVVDDVYSEGSSGLNVFSERCTFSNGKIKGIIFDLSIIKNMISNYPTYDDITRISEEETEFNREFGKIFIWKREINNVHNKNNPFCQASLKEANGGIKLTCINHPINCIHNNEYKCYTNPMGANCYCYNELFYEKHNMDYEERAMKYGFKEGDSRIVTMENKATNYNISKLESDLDDSEISKECRAIILCSNDVTTPIIRRCSSSPYSIGCPCSLNPYSKLCGCYINPFNPGCHCTYNRDSSDCKCLLRPEECESEHRTEVGYEIVNRAPFDLRQGIRRFYRKHFRKSSSDRAFNKNSYCIITLITYLLIALFNK